MHLSKTLKTYQKRLTNLTARNKSLLLLGLSVEQFLDVQDLDFLNNEPAFEVVAGLMAQKRNLPLCEVLDSRMERLNEASKRLRKIARKASFIATESGSHDLYLGYPVVQGKYADGTVLRCPLLFWSVELSTQTRKNTQGLLREQWVLSPKELPQLNRSFLLGYAHFNKSKVPDEVIEKTFEDFPPDSLAFRTALYEFLRDSGLAINFNKELFNNQLEVFLPQKKANLETTEKAGELKLYPQAVLGIFPQAGSYLEPDYEALIEKFEAKNTTEELFPPNNVSPVLSTGSTLVSIANTNPGTLSNLLAPLWLDASQEQALNTIRAGASVVVQGPPGTGKSQLICNLVADYTARGKTVLVVSQKRAALDTVSARLQTLGMMPFAGLVHDFKQDRKDLYEQILTQIGAVENYRTQNQSLDAIVLEREFSRICWRISETTKQLEEFRVALFDDTLCGLSAKELYLRMAQSKAKHRQTVGEVYRSFSFRTLTDFERRFHAYHAYAHLQQAPHPWADRLSFSRKSWGDVPALLEQVRAMAEVFRNLPTHSQQTTGKILAWSEVETLQKAEIDWEYLHQNVDNEWIEKILNQEITIKTITWLKQKQKNLRNLQQQGLLQSKLPTATVRSILHEALMAQNLWWKWLFFNKKAIGKIANENGLGINNLKPLSALLNNQENYEQIQAEVSEVLSKKTPDFEAIWEAEKVTKYLKKKNIEWIWGRVERVEKYLQKQKESEQIWQQHLSQKQIETLSENPAFAHELEKTLAQDFDHLVEADTLRQGFSHSEWFLVEKFQTWEALLYALYVAWLGHIEAQSSILRMVSSLKMKQLEQELQEAIIRKHSLSQAILLLRLREQTYRNIEVNRLNNRTTYRELQHQVSKKRKIWPLRKLLEHHTAEVFDLIPCWLASPETVSAIFPLGVIHFDLVVFDEASQCFAEQGIPAIFRAKQVVIAGDSQQLPPNDLYRIRFEEEDIEENIALEIDSLLDLAAQYLPQVWLRGHYRSKSLELIRFSNEHFYKNTLQMIPDFEYINRQERAIEYRQVGGIWENQCNIIEAQAVIDLLMEIRGTQAHKTVGIVAFNHNQANIITDLLTEQSLDNEQYIFVKNIENVQGDERDIIIFSVGYAPNKQGKMAMQFGSLNLQGGENRLNVAITRAREKVYVVASISPQELRVEDALHNGPKLLKKYLEYAQNKQKPTIQPLEDGGGVSLAKYLIEIQNGLQLTDVSFADAVQKTPNGQYQSLLLTDDEAYRQSLNIKEPHGYLPLMLKAKNWPYERVWSRVLMREK